MSPPTTPRIIDPLQPKVTMEYPSITVGVITHSMSFVDFSSFLKELSPAFEQYPTRCQLVIVNNSGAIAAQKTQTEVSLSPITRHCDCSVIASSENNIAVGRNTIFEHANHKLIAMIDDDEFPTPAWLVNLVATYLHNDCGVVAGPTYPLYLFDTSVWVRHLDLHNAEGKFTNDKISNCPTANVLIDRSKIVGGLFNPKYGESGGEDTEFFLRQNDSNVDMRWNNEACVYEYIPKSKSSSRYMIKRCILQGALNRKILTKRGDIVSQFAFVVRSLSVFFLSITIGGLFLLGRSGKSGKWLKRAFGNLGHCIPLPTKLYPHT